MNPVPAHRSQPLRSDQLALLLRQLRVQAGITIESPQQVIDDCIGQRMASLGIGNLDDYLAGFDNSINARAEWLALIDLLTVKETRFFRQPAACECLGDHLRDLIQRGPAPREFSFWSAGCATGQETYSLAMTVEDIMRDQAPFMEWHGIGTDLSFQAISQAQRGCYRPSSTRSMPAAFRDKYLQEQADGELEVAADLRARTHFFHSNLLHLHSAPFADFDAIFCQNVLIYFERDRQRWIIDQLVERLRPGGLLILGAGEDARWNNPTMRRLPLRGVCAYKKSGG